MSTALVTGATAGIGAEFARQLAARGHDLVLVARSTEGLERMASALPTAVEVLPADLSVRDDVARVAARLADPARPVEILVNNAGFGYAAGLTDADTTPHETALDVMARAPLVLGAAAARVMRGRGHGRIINVASLSAWITQGSYSAVKAYAKVWSEGLASELAGSGVTVTALCPGWVRTEFHDRAGLEGQSSRIPDWVWVDAERTVRECLAHADAGKVLSIPTKRWKVAAFALQHAPRGVVHLIGRSMAAAANDEPVAGA